MLHARRRRWWGSSGTLTLCHRLGTLANYHRTLWFLVLESGGICAVLKYQACLVGRMDARELNKSGYQE
jgi:hypothetical protein